MNAIPSPLDVDLLVIGYGRGGTTLAARLGRLTREQQAVERGHRILAAKKAGCADRRDATGEDRCGEAGQRGVVVGAYTSGRPGLRRKHGVLMLFLFDSPSAEERAGEMAARWRRRPTIRHSSRPVVNSHLGGSTTARVRAA
jgi:choline dehydrogenase-like flavoprotein